MPENERLPPARRHAAVMTLDLAAILLLATALFGLFFVTGHGYLALVGAAAAAGLAGVVGCTGLLTIAMRDARRRLWPVLVMVGLVALFAGAARWNPYLKSLVGVLGNAQATPYVSRVDVWERTLA
ncbi:MAG: hypothetical protein IMZ67_00255 [Acidobacteria bacterium]|nr:hypothetical protein [Acidobacteriota bacterium]